MGKQTRTPSRIPGRGDPFKRATEPGELIHTDIAGGGNITQTMGGKKYMYLLLDDATDRSEIHLLRHKAEAYEIARKFFQKIKNRGTPVQRFRGDNAGENGSQKMRKLYDDFSI